MQNAEGPHMLMNVMKLSGINYKLLHHTYHPIGHNSIKNHWNESYRDEITEDFC